ncbi:MAG: hypothetical protein ACTHZX_08055 [Microbacterium sp.]
MAELRIGATRSASYAELRAAGWRRIDIESALDVGALIRARRDVYVTAAASEDAVSAARVGGRLDGVSLMRERGVFVLHREGELHVQLPRHRSRLRSPESRFRRLDGRRDRVVVHWRDDDVPRDSLHADTIPAVARAVVDQPPRAAIATLDSVLSTGLLAPTDLGAVFDRLPSRLHRIRKHVDGRAESGPETFARLLARTLGISVQPQVQIDGVGRVDLVVDGWIVIECDSRAFHGGWEQQERDRLRDLSCAERGYVTIRPTARQIYETPGVLREALVGLLRSARR